MLTKKQNGLLLFIKDFIERHGFGPTYAEMSDAIGMRSIGPSQYLFNQLAEMGYVSRLYGRARAVQVLRMPGDPIPGVKEQNMNIFMSTWRDLAAWLGRAGVWLRRALVKRPRRALRNAWRDLCDWIEDRMGWIF